MASGADLSQVEWSSSTVLVNISQRVHPLVLAGPLPHCLGVLLTELNPLPESGRPAHPWLFVLCLLCLAVGAARMHSLCGPRRGSVEMCSHTLKHEADRRQATEHLPHTSRNMQPLVMTEESYHSQHVETIIAEFMQARGSYWVEVGHNRGLHLQLLDLWHTFYGGSAHAILLSNI